MANRLFKPVLNTPSTQQKSLPFYPLLPKDPTELLKWKMYARERCIHDLDFRDSIHQMCKQDVAFWAATFLWLHETRPGITKSVGKFPFLPDCDQVDVLALLADELGYEDFTIFKTRAIGGSYLVDIVLLWLWLYRGESLEFALVSKDEDSLDIKNRPSTLMGKLDLLFSCLPVWMRTDKNGKEILHRTTSNHQFLNKTNGNVILGFVPTSDKLRSGRYFCVILDEAAFFPADFQRWITTASGTTNSILWLSTFDGTANTFYHLATSDKENLIRIELYWMTNPRWAKGTYKSVNGLIELLDPGHKYPTDFEFMHDEPNLPRSPMVDFYLSRAGADRAKVKEELYGAVVADSRKMLLPPVFEALARTEAPAPWRGNITDTGEFIESLDGDWLFWKPPEALGGTYEVGVDPALGSGQEGAFAAASVLDVNTGELICTGAVRPIECHDFARMIVKLAKLLSGVRGTGYARIAYELTGTGVLFGNELKRLNYPAIYQERKGVNGIHTPDRCEKILLELGRAIRDKEIAIHDSRVIEDLGGFEYDKRKNKLIFAGTDGHGDIAVSTALAWWAAKDRRKGIIAQQQAATKDPITADLELRNKGTGCTTWSDQFVRRGRF